MKIQILGARALNPIACRQVKKYTSARFFAQNKKLQIDVGNPWQGLAHYLLITHLHPDHVGQIKTVPKNTLIYVPDLSFKKFLEKKTSARIKVLPKKKPVSIAPFALVAFPVNHSKHTKAFGFKIKYKKKAVVWLPDFRNLQGCLQFMKNLEALFIGASAFKKNISHTDHDRFGHLAIVQALKILRQQQIRPKKIFLIHLGRQLTPIKQKLRILGQMFPQYNISATFDGQKINLDKKGKRA